MMLHILETREEQLKHLQRFTQTVRMDVEEIAMVSNWTEKSIKDDKQNFLICPYDSGHRIMEKAIPRHLDSCQWKAEGYKESDVPLSEPPPYLQSSLTCIKLDMQLQNEILRNAKRLNPTLGIESYKCYTWHRLNIGLDERLVPRTSDRILTDFTLDERKALYEYVISNTVKAEIGQHISDACQSTTLDGDKQLTSLELLVQERNLKRRRAKHRGVHTNKKSHTEILREVIDQQMEMHTSYVDTMCDISSLQDSQIDGLNQSSAHQSIAANDNDHGSSRNSLSKHRDITTLDRQKFRESSYEKYERSENRKDHRSRDRKDNSRKKYHHKSRSRTSDHNGRSTKEGKHRSREETIARSKKTFHKLRHKDN